MTHTSPLYVILHALTHNAASMTLILVWCRCSCMSTMRLGTSQQHCCCPPYQRVVSTCQSLDISAISLNPGSSSVVSKTAVIADLAYHISLTATVRS